MNPCGFRKSKIPLRQGWVGVGPKAGLFARGYGAVELRHYVPFHDFGQLVPVLMIGKCLF